MPITEEGLKLGHFYDSSRVNAPCEQCHLDYYLETGLRVTFLTCEYDDEA